MRAKELSPELKEQLKSCTTKEDAESCLKKHAVDLSVDEMEKIYGGGLFSGCWPWDHHWTKTGKTRERIAHAQKIHVDYFYTEEEYVCTACGETKWEHRSGN